MLKEFNVRTRCVPTYAITIKPSTMRVMSPNTPLLCVERGAFSYGEKPVEFRRGYYRTDKHYYRNELG